MSAEVNGLCVHSLRATAATNALSHEADIARPRQCINQAPLRPAQDATRGQSDVSGEIIEGLMSDADAEKHCELSASLR